MHTHTRAPVLARLASVRPPAAAPRQPPGAESARPRRQRSWQPGGQEGEQEVCGWGGGGIMIWPPGRLQRRGLEGEERSRQPTNQPPTMSKPTDNELANHPPAMLALNRQPPTNQLTNHLPNWHSTDSHQPNNQTTNSPITRSAGTQQQSQPINQPTNQPGPPHYPTRDPTRSEFPRQPGRQAGR